MDAQQQHDLEMSEKLDRLIKQSPEEKAASKQRLEALLAQKSATSSSGPQSTEFDPIELAMRNHPGLTREKAEKMAEDLGF